VDWIEILSYAVAGALGAAFAYLTVGDKKERRGLYSVVTVAAMLAFHALGARFILPTVYNWQADRELKRIPLYSEIADSDPEAYKKITTILLEGRKKGESKHVVESRIAPIITSTLPRYVPNASDGSINAFVAVLTQDARDLSRASPDACYQFLFPQNFSSPTSAELDDAATNRTLGAMADVLHSAIHNPQSPPDPEESQALLKPIASGLAEKYGSDLLILQRTAADSPEREKVCDMAIDLYVGILNLPPKESSEVLRTILTAK
jgi:hypothetical protein